MGEGLTVLVVDDEPDVRWALEMVLRTNRFTVATVGSGGDALRWLSDYSCQLILLDAKLGDSDGVELANRIRTLTSCQAPIILVSGYFYKDDSLVQHSLAMGLISAFVTKPFNHNEIIDTITSILSIGGNTLPMAPSP